jgi:hypothetical protein
MVLLLFFSRQINAFDPHRQKKASKVGAGGKAG